MCCQQDQIKPVADLINAVFYGHARHAMSLRSLGLQGLCMLMFPASYREDGLFARPIYAPCRANTARSARGATSKTQVAGFGQENALLRHQRYTFVAPTSPNLR